MHPEPHAPLGVESGGLPDWPDISHEGVLATACYIRQDKKVLMQLKASHKFGGDRWNGPGGKLEPREDPEAAVIREVREETGLIISDPIWHGTLTFVFNSPERYRLTSHIFSVRDFTGKPRGGAEGRLRWFQEERLPYDRMWVDDRYWLPAVLDGARIRGLCVFADDEGRAMADFQLAVRWPSQAGRGAGE
jgi:8-oxo-dGTP diphosphatase